MNRTHQIISPRASKRTEFIYEAAVYFMVSSLTIAWATTSEQSYQILQSIRNVLFVFHFASILLLIGVQLDRFSEAFLATAILVTLGIYSWCVFEFHAAHNDGQVFSHVLWVFVSSGVAVTFLLAPRQSGLLPERVAIVCVVTTIAVFLLTFALGGFELGRFKFVFDFTTSSGNELTYSQSLSKYYGLAAVFSTTLGSNKFRIRTMRSLWLLSGLFFLILSWLGGGRGDFIATALVCVLSGGAKRLFAVALFSIIIYYLFSEPIIQLMMGNEVIVDRYFALLQSLGARDTLLVDCINLLANEPVYFIFGGGIGFFQHYHDYEMGMYPHNVPFETVISFGILIPSVLAWIIVHGRRKAEFPDGRNEHFSNMAIFLLLISLKSGSLITSFLLVGIVTFLVVSSLRLREN